MLAGPRAGEVFVVGGGAAAAENRKNKNGGERLEFTWAVVWECLTFFPDGRLGCGWV